MKIGEKEKMKNFNKKDRIWAIIGLASICLMTMTSICLNIGWLSWQWIPLIMLLGIIGAIAFSVMGTTFFLLPLMSLNKI
jgi:hypothetical protein